MIVLLGDFKPEYLSKTDIRLLYQKDSGLGLEHIHTLMDKAIEIKVTCEDCDTEWNEAEHIPQELFTYMTWLEEELEASLSVGEALLWKVKEGIFWKERNKSKNETSEPKG